MREGRTLRMAVIACLVSAASVLGLAGPASATSVSAVAAEFYGTTASTSWDYPFSCTLPNSITYAPEAVLTGIFSVANTAGTGSAVYAGRVWTVASIVATATQCLLPNPVQLPRPFDGTLETKGTVGSAPIVSASLDSCPNPIVNINAPCLTGYENGGVFTQLGVVTIASLGLSYCVNEPGLYGCATNVPVTAVLASAGLGGSSPSYPIGAVAGAQVI